MNSSYFILNKTNKKSKKKNSYCDLISLVAVIIKASTLLRYARIFALFTYVNVKKFCLN